MRLTHIFLASITSALLPSTLAETSSPLDALTEDALANLTEPLSKLGLSPESLRPKPLAHTLIDQVFGTMEAAVSPLPGHGKTMAHLLSGARKQVHDHISADAHRSPAPKTSNARLSSRCEEDPEPQTPEDEKDPDIGDIDENSEIGEVLVALSKRGCNCVSATGNLAVHLVRALHDAAFGIKENLIHGEPPGLGAVLHALSDKGETVRGPLHNNLTTLADVLTVESVCGDYEHAITTGDIDEDSTVTEVLNALPPVECRCLATLLYFIVHLVRAVLELCFEISIAIVYHLGLGSLGDALVSLLEATRDVLHVALTTVAEFFVPKNVCRLG